MFSMISASKYAKNEKYDVFTLLIVINGLTTAAATLTKGEPPAQLCIKRAILNFININRN